MSDSDISSQADGTSPAGDLRTTEALRTTSKAAFNSQYRIEIAMAILRLDTTFTFEELQQVVRAVAVRSAVDPPSDSNVRTEVARLRTVYGALDRLPRAKGEQVRREVRRESPLWSLCEQIHSRHLPTP